jgi:tRNA(adenine34) deaminase
MTEDEQFMLLAMREAEKAREVGEVPCGCVVVKEGRVIARGWNQVETLKDATAHAEMLALSSAFAVKGNWRLAGCRLYVTKEPCPMCAGAIVLSRVSKVIWGLGDPKRGGGTVFGIFSHPGINHHPQITEGVLEEESRAVLQDFFRRRRAESSAVALERAEK